MAPVSETEVDVGEGISAGGLSQADCICPVCLEIFLEPVTLPCGHTFCKPCFLETVDKANLCCPLCRLRVSTWARLNGRNKTLVNVELWRRLQEAFPTQCQRRVSGQDMEDMATVASRPRVSLPGELRREYEDQICKLAEEKRALEDAERRASEEYIQRLLAEEEEQRAEERQALEERQLEEDERLARLLSLELNSSPMSESQRIVHRGDSAATKKKSAAGDIERFLSPLPMRSSSFADTSPSSSLAANKENILMLPSSAVTCETPMPTLDYCGNEWSVCSPPEVTKPLPPDVSHSQFEPDAGGWSSSLSQARGGASVKRKSGDMAAAGGPCSDSKRPRTPAFMVSDAPLVQELAQEEEELFSRRQQEESDQQLPVRLQKQLDGEEAQRAVDRSKGSPDEYLLLLEEFIRKQTSQLKQENILMLPSSAVTCETPMPTLDYFGNERSVCSPPEVTKPLPPDASHSQLEPDAGGWSSSLSQARGGASVKRKSGDMAIAGGPCSDSKRPCTPAFMVSDTPLVQELAQEEEELFSRRQQEESDRRLALQLQKQLDREEAQRAVDRSKGSPDEYLLRDKLDSAPSAAAVDSPVTRATRARSSAAPAQREQKNKLKRQTSSTSKDKPALRKDNSSSSASVTDPAPLSPNSSHLSTTSALQKGRKQTTLTEMFPSLAS